MMNPNLPEELLIEIFSRLPSKSVGRCRCLSKLWRSRLSNSQFLDLHLTHKPHQRNLILITVDETTAHTTHTTPLPLAGETVLKKLDGPNNWGWKKIDFPNNWVYAVGSCNGLVLMIDGRDAIYLVNPVTKEQVRIPNYIFNRFPPKVKRYGFGYDSSSKDYKIVMLGISPYCPAAVYSFKTGVWVRKDNCPFEYHIFGSGALLDGALHWFVVASKESGQSPMILAFDLSSEIIRTITVPTYANGSALGNSWKTQVLKGCLCLVNSREPYMDAWMLKKYGLQDSWTNLTFYFGLHGAYKLQPICYVEEDELLFTDYIIPNRRMSLFISNLKEKSIKVVCRRCDNVAHVCEFVDSLVSPKQLAGLAERE